MSYASLDPTTIEEARATIATLRQVVTDAREAEALLRKEVSRLQAEVQRQTGYAAEARRDADDWQRRFDAEAAHVQTLNREIVSLKRDLNAARHPEGVLP